METKDYKSVYIHNGCRNPKMTVVKKDAKIKSPTFWEYILLSLALNYQYLMDLNVSLRDAELQKALLSFNYLNSKEYVFAKLKIAFIDLKISFHQQLIKKLTREK